MLRARSLLLALAALALLAPASASAASAGSTQIDLGGRASKSLRSQGVVLKAKHPARIVDGVLRLPVSTGIVTSTAYLNQRGGLVVRRKLKGRWRSLTISELQLRIGARSSVVGSVGRTRLTVFTLAAPASTPSLNARNGSVSLRGASVTLTRKAGTAIKRALKLRKRPGGRFGTATVEALVTGTGDSGPGGSGPGGGGGGNGTPGSGPISNEPPLLTRPASAVDVSGLTLSWYPRDSWLRYLNTSTASGDGVIASGGVTPAPTSETSDCPDTGTPTNPGLPYSYAYPAKNGWYDPVSGHAGLYFQGAVTFRWKGHGIDLTASDPEIEVTGDSRAIFRFSGSDGTAYPDQRAELVKLAATPQPGASGQVTYTLAKGSLTADGASVFAGFYPAGGGFGCVSVSFTAP